MADHKTFNDAIRIALREESMEETETVCAEETQNNGQVKEIIGLLTKILNEKGPDNCVLDTDFLARAGISINMLDRTLKWNSETIFLATDPPGTRFIGIIYESKNDANGMQKILNNLQGYVPKFEDNGTIQYSQFRVFLWPIRVTPENAEKIVLASCALHNYLRSKDSASYTPNGSFDSELVETGKVVAGEWRNCEPTRWLRLHNKAPTDIPMKQKKSGKACQSISTLLVQFLGKINLNWSTRENIILILNE
eukprot:gene7292-12992_t